jgi:hypothetical protein
LIDGNLAGAIWEELILSILPLLSDQSRKHDLILEIMRRTPIPWSNDLEIMMKQASEDSGNIELKEQYHMLNLKKMLGKYNLKGEIATKQNVLKSKFIQFF